MQAGTAATHSCLYSNQLHEGAGPNGWTSTLSSLEAAEDSGWSGVANRSAPVVIRSPTAAEEQNGGRAVRWQGRSQAVSTARRRQRPAQRQRPFPPPRAYQCRMGTPKCLRPGGLRPPAASLLLPRPAAGAACAAGAAPPLLPSGREAERPLRCLPAGLAARSAIRSVLTFCGC